MYRRLFSQTGPVDAAVNTDQVKRRQQVEHIHQRKGIVIELNQQPGVAWRRKRKKKEKKKKKRKRIDYSHLGIDVCLLKYTNMEMIISLPIKSTRNMPATNTTIPLFTARDTTTTTTTTTTTNNSQLYDIKVHFVNDIKSSCKFVRS